MAVDALADDTRVIRNRRKLQAITDNARRMIELDEEYGTFQKYLRSHDSFWDLVRDLRKQLKFLGDMGAYYWLYVIGEDVPPHEQFEAERPQKKRKEGRGVWVASSTPGRSGLKTFLEGFLSVRVAGSTCVLPGDFKTLDVVGFLASDCAYFERELL